MSLCTLKLLNVISGRSFSVAKILATKGDLGSGIGMGGGSGGSIREAGGKFGEREAAFENAYFKKLEAEQFKALKKHHDEEIKHHEDEIQRHMDAIKRLKGHQNELKEAINNKEKQDSNE